MEFSSLIFLFLFLPLLLLVFFSLKQEAHNAFLVLASLFFYAFGEGAYALVLIVSILFNYFSGLWLQSRLSKGVRKLLFIQALLFNLGLLFVFKYAHFVALNLGIPVSKTPIHLPIGISFYTFLALSYIIDVYRETRPVQRNFIDFALYISLFPKLVTGPLTLYHSFSPQLGAREIGADDFAIGVKRFIIGLGKKVLLADGVARVANQVFSIPAVDQTAGLAWLGILCYTLQIYFDFSGYSDMAIGLGRLLGFKFPENFNYPYVSRSIREFWTRWHITLANWLRDYLFLPISYAVSRRIKGERLLGIKAENWMYMAGAFFTFLLCGIWHGANWTFFVWGGYYGILLVIEHLFLRKFLKKSRFRVWQFIYCQVLVMIGWVFFRSPDLSYAFVYLRAMFGLGTGSNLVYYPALYLDMEAVVWIVLGLLGSFPLVPAIGNRLRGSGDKGAGGLYALIYALVSGLFLILVFLASILTLVSGTYQPFIYFRF